MDQFLEQRTDGTDDLPLGQDIDEQEIANHHNRRPSDHGIKRFTLPLAQFQELFAVRPGKVAYSSGCEARPGRSSQPPGSESLNR